MTEFETAAASRPTLSLRSGASRKLLARKAAEQAAKRAPADEGLEADFPVQADADVGPDATLPLPPVDGGFESSTVYAAAELANGAAGNAGASATHHAVSQATWSGEDEAALQALLARRKASGFQRRGRDVSAQALGLGDIKPNPGTVVAVIVDLVAARAPVLRSELVDLMASQTFPNAKAKPNDKGWCQGYVAGAIRDGFLAVSDAKTSETS